MEFIWFDAELNFTCKMFNTLAQLTMHFVELITVFDFSTILDPKSALLIQIPLVL